MSYHAPIALPAAAPVPEPIDDPHVGLARSLRVGTIAVATLGVGLFGLAAAVNVTGAVIGYGEVSVESSVKKIAHPTGGVVAALYVHDGDRVRAGQPLMRLDTTVASVTASASGEGLLQLLAERARLTAERDGAGAVVFPPVLLADASPAARAAMDEQRRVFQLRRSARLGQQAQLGERIRQTQNQIGSYRAQLAASHRQSALIQPERAGVRMLWEKKLITINRLNELERTAVSLEGSAASLEAEMAQARARIAELRQSAIQLDQDARSQAGVELAQTIAKLGEQQVRSVSAGDAFQRSVLRAPGAGVVDKLAFSTVGGVVPAAQTVMEIVPDTERMIVEAKVSVSDIDQVHVGQAAMLHFSAFNVQTTPQVEGRLVQVAPERTVDERTGSAYYKVRIAPDAAALRRLGGLKLVPGMPVESYIQTERRSLLSYITKPLRDQVGRSFREN